MEACSRRAIGMCTDRAFLLLRATALAWAVLALAILGCSAGGSQALSRRFESRADGATPAEKEQPETPLRDLRSSEELRSLAYMAGEESAEVAASAALADAQDPFGLIQADWPADVPLHPQAQVADSGRAGSKGYFLVVLIPSEAATLAGVQNFHIGSLSEWESLRVHEQRDEDESGDGPTLTIVAERPGELLEITAGPAPSGLLESLSHNDHWLMVMGPEPLWARLTFIPYTPRE